MLIVDYFVRIPGTIRYIGNSLTSRDSMMTSEARGSYLLRHIVFKKGVVTSFVAYFMRREPVWFQVWRPISTLDGLTYMLVDQVRFLTNWYPSREQVSVVSRNIARVILMACMLFGQALHNKKILIL